MNNTFRGLDGVIKQGYVGENPMGDAARYAMKKQEVKKEFSIFKGLIISHFASLAAGVLSDLLTMAVVFIIFVVGGIEFTHENIGIALLILIYLRLKGITETLTQ